MKTSDPPIIARQSFETTPAELWSAITEVDRMTQWFFENIPDFEAEAGFQTQFVVQVEDRTFTHQWTITDVVLGKSITYRWAYKEYPGVGKVVFSISGDPTTLTLTNTIDENFPSDVPEFNREACIGGWNYFINGRLKSYLDGTNS